MSVKCQSMREKCQLLARLMEQHNIWFVQADAGNVHIIRQVQNFLEICEPIPLQTLKASLCAKEAINDILEDKIESCLMPFGEWDTDNFKIVDEILAEETVEYLEKYWGVGVLETLEECPVLSTFEDFSVEALLLRELTEPEFELLLK